MTKLEQEAFEKLRDTLGFSDCVDLYVVLCTANLRIKRLEDLVDERNADGQIYLR